jgi:glutaminyl-tRNA synthetase
LAPEGAPRDFLRAIVIADVARGKHGGRVATRFPPEPNGYLHIGHAKSICLNFGIAREFGGTCNLRFDDTNPETENPEFVDSIAADVRWLGFEWDGLYHASDYFERFYELAVQLIEDGKAYVDDLSDEEISAYRGSLTEPGRESPYRDRPIAENLDLFRRMRAGEFPDGARVLRARIDMAAANMKMRDPLLYRIRHAHHHRTGDRWCIYPMYDLAHPLSDAFEDITHSFCTLEFDNNREVYDWVVEHTGVPHRPQQIEFARLNLSYTVMSKRKLARLVNEGHVDGWDDPRMPTLAGLRRRGVTPEAIRSFCDAIGVAKSNSVVDLAQLEHALRDDLNTRAPRVLGVLDPLKVVIENYPEGRVEELEAPLWPRDVPREGSRPLPFCRELWIDRADFHLDPPKGFHRLAPGREVRLRYAYFIRCERVVTDEEGHPVELRCTYDPATRGGQAPDGRKVPGTLHWVSARHAVPVETRLYDRLFAVERPDGDPAGRSFTELLNPHSLQVMSTAWVEPWLAGAAPGERFQFERLGYFYLEPEATRAAGRPVFNRIVALKDSWAREEPSREPIRAAPPPAPPPRAAARPVPERPRERSGAEGARYEHLRAAHGLPEAQADLLARDPDLARLFEEAVAVHDRPVAVATWLVNDFLGTLAGRPVGEAPVTGEAVGELMGLLEGGAVTGRTAREVLVVLLADGGSPAEVVERLGVGTVDDPEELARAVCQVLADHPAEVASYRAGKQALLGFLIGRVMSATRGRADGAAVKELLLAELAR